MAITETLPETLWVIDVPERPEDIAKRWHNKYAKDALRETVIRWHGHERGFRKHFRRDARRRYRHFPRTEKYERYKARRFHSTVDLIKTWRTKRRMLSQFKITVGGSAGGDNLNATLILSFPFTGGTGRFRKSSQGMHQVVTIQKMRIELERMDEEDPKLLAEWFLKAYMKKVAQHRSNRQRIRISR